jgi:hypothetical protein
MTFALALELRVREPLTRGSAVGEGPPEVRGFPHQHHQESLLSHAPPVAV